MKDYDVGISFASDDGPYAAALYRRLAERLEVFFSPSAAIASDDLLDGLKLTYEKSTVVAVVVGQSYPTKDWPAWEYAEAVQRLREREFDRVQLIRVAGCKWPKALSAILAKIGDVGFELPDNGWELAMDGVVQLILSKLRRLAEKPEYAGPSAPPFHLRRYQQLGATVPIPVARHFPSLKPLFPVPPQTAILTEYVVESVQGYASLHGHVEQLRRANAIVVALRHLADCSANSGENFQRLEVSARAAAKKVLSCLRSTAEVHRAMAGTVWDTPDDAQMIQRLKHYFLRHLFPDAHEPTALASVVDSLNRLLCMPPADIKTRRLLLAQLSSDASLSAESIQYHFWNRNTQRALPDDRDPSPSVLQCAAIESTLQRRNTWGEF